MADRWTYVGKCKWNPGSNIPALSAGGVGGGNTLNAAGMQLFGNLLTNASKLLSDTLRQGCLAMTGAHTTPVIDAVTLVAAMSGVSRKTARDGVQSWRVVAGSRPSQKAWGAHNKSMP